MSFQRRPSWAWQFIAAFIFIFLFVGQSHSVDGEMPWVWKYAGTVYDSKAEAMAAMRAATTNGSYLTRESVDSVANTEAGYKYTAPDIDPEFSDWGNYQIVHSGMGGFTNGPFTSVQAAIANGNGVVTPSQGCPGANFFVVGSWVDNPGATLPSVDMSYVLVQNLALGISYMTKPAGNTQEGCTERVVESVTGYSVKRTRTVSCPAPYSKNTYTGKCVITRSGLISRKLADHGCPVKAGNPCDAASGEKTLAENDYTAAHFNFTRHYSSTGFDANFISTNSPGWSHNFDARIVPGQYGSLTGGMVHSGKVYRVARAGTDLLKIPNARVGFRKLANGNWLLEKDGTRDIFHGTTGLLLSREWRRGQVLTLAYDADKRLTSISDPAGRTLWLHYDANNRLARLTTPGGHETIYSYDGVGNLTTVTRPDGSIRQYHYEEGNFPHALTGITDENGHRYATYSYDSLGRAVSTSHAGGIGLHTLTYNIDNTVVTNPLGAQTTYKFKTINNSRAVHTRTEPCANCAAGISITTYAYDGSGNVIQRTDGRGVITKYTYNATRNLETARTEAFGTPLARTISTQWHATLRRPVQITEPGRLTTFTYDVDDNVLTRSVTTGGQTRLWTYTYNSAGQLLTEDGPRSDVSDITTYSYDALGNLTSVTNALGHATQVTLYDLDGRPLTLVDANGISTVLAYDARSRLTSSTRAGATTHFTYDNVGNVLTSTDPAGVTLTYAYDVDNRLIRLTDAAGNRIEYTLNLLGGRTSEKVYDPASQLAFSRHQVFDTLNRLQQVLNAGSQERQRYTYDATGNVLSQQDGLLHGTTSTWDALGRLANSLDSSGGNTVYGYDAQDNLTSVTDAAGLVTTYAYNGFGERTSETSPNTGTTTFTRGSAGELLTRTDARGITSSYSHDALGRVTAISYPNSALNLSFSYDQGTNGIGRLTGMTDASGSTYYSYNSLGQLTSAQHAGLGSSYLYDAAGRLTRLTYPSGHALVYARDNAGRVSSLNLEINGQTWPVASAIHWQPQGGLAALTYGNGLTWTRTKDTNGLLTANTVPGVLAQSFAHDDADRLVGLTDALNSALSQTFQYDVLDRLTHATDSFGAEAFSYSPNGNRTQRMTTGSSAGTTSYQYDSGSQRLASFSGMESDNRNHDATGNTTERAGQTLGYDDRGRLVSVSGNGQNASYQYNGRGERISKAVNGQTTRFVYHTSGQLLAETDASHTTTREYLWLEDWPVGVISMSGGTARLDFIHADHLGTPRRLTDSQQTVIWRWESTPFGDSPADADPDGDSVNTPFNLRFPGQYLDSESGLHYNYFRDYDPGTGRYVQSDPIGLEGGVNTYGYANQSPLMLTDPLGLNPVLVGKGMSLLATAVGRAGTTATGALLGAAGADALNDQCPNPFDCAELVTRINQAMAVVKSRYFALAHDKLDLFTRRPTGPMSWQGHIQQFHNSQSNLRQVIFEAQTKGCPIPGEAWHWASVQAPQTPFLKR